MGINICIGQVISLIDDCAVHCDFGMHFIIITENVHFYPHSDLHRWSPCHSPILSVAMEKEEEE